MQYNKLLRGFKDIKGLIWLVLSVSDYNNNLNIHNQWRYIFRTLISRIHLIKLKKSQCKYDLWHRVILKKKKIDCIDLIQNVNESRHIIDQLENK